MEISKFTLSEPDSEGSCDVDVELKVTNVTNVKIDQVRWSAMFFDHKGIIAEGYNETAEDEALNPGDSYERSPFLSAKNKWSAGERDDVKLCMDVRLLSRSLIDFGKIEIPQTDSDDVIVKVSVDSDIIESPVQLRVRRDAPDSDGDSKVTACCIIFNKTNEFVDAIQLNATLYDAKDSEIESMSNDVQLPPSSAAFAESSFWGFKKGNL